MKRRGRKTIQSVLVGSLAGAVLVLAPAMWVAPVPPPWIPNPLVEAAFDTRLWIATPAKSFTSLLGGDLQDRRIYFPDAGRTVRFRSDDVQLMGTLYESKLAGRRPGVLLLHGSGPKGRRLGLYQLLGSELSARGYHVLAIDQRGYGDSDDPPDVSAPESFDYRGDALRALAYLASLPDVDGGDLHLLGHSFGADVAMSAGLESPMVNSIAAFGPARRFTSTAGTLDAPQLDYFRRREMRYLDLPGPPSRNVFLRYRTPLLMENQRRALADPCHTPILFIDGEREGEGRLRFLAEEYAAVAGEKAHYTLAGADHYANVAEFGPLVLYDRAAVHRLAAIIERWSSEHPRRAACVATPAAEAAGDLHERLRSAAWILTARTADGHR